MRSETSPIDLDCPTRIRTVAVGGLTKPELIQALRQNAVFLNEYAEMLFASELFTISETRRILTTFEVSVRELGFLQGAAIAEIYRRAGELGLGLCPLELGPCMRLQYRDQPEGYWGKPVVRNQAPPGSITIASEQLTNDDGFPKGFYLRRIEGSLWLRGYCCDHLQVWHADDHLVFVNSANPTSGSPRRLASEEGRL
jgi:hypothetical protein